MTSSNVLFCLNKSLKPSAQFSRQSSSIYSWHQPSVTVWRSVYYDVIMTLYICGFCIHLSVQNNFNQIVIDQNVQDLSWQQ